MGTYARDDNNLTRVDSNTFTMRNPKPKSTLTLCQSRLYPSQGLCMDLDCKVKASSGPGKNSLLTTIATK